MNHICKRTCVQNQNLKSWILLPSQNEILEVKSYNYTGNPVHNTGSLLLCISCRYIFLNKIIFSFETSKFKTKSRLTIFLLLKVHNLDKLFYYDKGSGNSWFLGCIKILTFISHHTMTHHLVWLQSKSWLLVLRYGFWEQFWNFCQIRKHYRLLNLLSASIMFIFI